MAAAPWLEPGCVVLDLAGSMWSAIDVLDRLRVAAPNHPVVVCGCDDVALAVAAMKVGAADVLDRPVGWTALAGAVAQALEAQAFRSAAPAHSAATARVAKLTPRQRGVLRGLMAGKFNKTIAHELGVSARTVECHRAAIMTRTGAASLSELIRIGIAAGL
ncbi:response regulator transcription factor [Phenylobacterium sp.]|uniref:response regulator transcription factor n=1 Tax=Phenylobacterium sp. TaxID=1871053 RepID=UPI002D09FD5C|nr:LuxR C-terminal-related transcriptional regulator [Phenylobacterium sp.]HLZ75509.1 LuxR C-terminal-related transcriptional regulator [Phenylobacterium sp.]